MDQGYSEKVDLWSIGCIIGELMIGSPLFRGEEPKHVVKAMQQQLGLIEESNCPSARRAQGETYFLQCNKGQSFANQAIVPDHPEWDAFIKHCLRYDPAQRPSAPEALAMVPTGPGTCAVIEESQAQTSLACALPPSGTKRHRLTGKSDGRRIASADLSRGLAQCKAAVQMLMQLQAAKTCKCSCNCGNLAHAPRFQPCTHPATAGTLEKPLCKHCVCLVDGRDAPRNKS